MKKKETKQVRVSHATHKMVKIHASKNSLTMSELLEMIIRDSASKATKR